MNILFLSIGNLYNIADHGIYTDLLRKFRDKGHNLYVISPREKRLNVPTEHLIEDGVTFLRVKIGNINKTNIIEKGISTIRIESLFLKELKKYYSHIKFDLILYSTPPITFDKIIRFIKKRDGAKSYLMLKDIFPQNAVDLNMFSKKSPIYWYFRQKEKNLYRNSDFIGCMSQANVDFVLKNNPEVAPAVIEVCPNSLELTSVDKDEQAKKNIRNKYGIPLNKTIFLFGGNLGKPQGIDFLIECLRSNKNNMEVYFVIVGSGTEFNKLKTYFATEKPRNAQLYAELPGKEYKILTNSCDAALIFLDRRFTIPNFPSRILDYMQASLPVLAATDTSTDIRQVIENGEFGFWCESNDVEQFNHKLNLLCDKEVQCQMGKRARQYLEENYTTSHTYEIIMKHFN